MELKHGGTNNYAVGPRERWKPKMLILTSVIHFLKGMRRLEPKALGEEGAVERGKEGGE